MKQRVGAVALALVAFVLGAAVQRYLDRPRPTPPRTAQAGRPAQVERPAPESRAVDRTAIHFEREPLWAYGFDRPPAPGEMAAPQNPPNRNLRPGQDPVEQTRLRRLEGSSATYSLVDIRDGQNVIDWFQIGRAHV